MSDDEIKHKASNQQVRAPEGTKPQSVPKRPLETPWHSMEEAPKDGTPLYFQNDPFKEEWYWYKTRQYRGTSWAETGWWRRRLGPAAPANFVPEGFRRVREGLPA